MALKLPRRTFLRGAGGAAIALPALDAMFDDQGRVHAQTGLPQRFLVTFAGTSIGGDSRQEDVVTPNPATPGPGYALLDGTRPLGDSRFGAAQDRVTIVSNLEIPVVGSPSSNSAETQPDFHSHHMSTLFAGTGGNGGVHGTTSDHLVHAAQADGTPLLTTRTQVDGRKSNGDGATASDGYLKSQMSWTDGRAPAAETEPGRMFERFFPGGSGGSMRPGSSSSSDPQTDFQRRTSASVLDLVHRRAARLEAKLGSVDRARLRDHLDAIRTLEGQLTAIPPTMMPPSGGTAACTGITADGHPMGMHPEVNNYYYERERAVAWASLWHLLFSCDLVRTGSHMHTFGQCFLPMNIITGQNTDFHETTHGGADGDHAKGVAWVLEEFGRLVSLLRDTPEGDGSVLDNCAITLLFEGGTAAEPGFGGGSHSVDHMTVLTAGGAGGLVQGEHVIAPDGYQPGNVVVTAMRGVGVDSNLGALNQEVPGLRR